jgi:dienelactone hydrolase
MASECDDKKFPAVIIQHGSGSPEKPWYSKLAMELNKRGIVAIVPNSFKARGISSTGSNQSKLSKATRLVDAFSTFKYLRTLNCVDPNRIGLTGYSFGGIIALDSAEKKIASKLGGGFEYKAVLPVYPSCQATFENPKSTKTKIHVLAGELDDFTPAKYCIDSVENKKMLGWDIEITVLKGAHHGFNLESAPSVIKNSWVFAECGTISISDDGYEKSNKYNVTTKNGWGQYVKTLVAKCGKKGPTIGGSPDLAKKTLEFTVKFFQHNL